MEPSALNTLNIELTLDYFNLIMIKYSIISYCLYKPIPLFKFLSHFNLFKVECKQGSSPVEVEGGGGLLGVMLISLCEVLGVWFPVECGQCLCVLLLWDYSPTLCSTYLMTSIFVIIPTTPFLLTTSTAGCSRRSWTMVCRLVLSVTVGKGSSIISFTL